MRLIDADKCLEDLGTVNPIYKDRINWAKNIIESMPTVEERPKGKWIDAIDTGVEMLECSACESRIKKRNYADSVGKEGYNYCPYCGAKMSKEENKNE